MPVLLRILVSFVPFSRKTLPVLFFVLLVQSQDALAPVVAKKRVAPKCSWPKLRFSERTVSGEWQGSSPKEPLLQIPAPSKSVPAGILSRGIPSGQKPIHPAVFPLGEVFFEMLAVTFTVF